MKNEMDLQTLRQQALFLRKCLKMNGIEINIGKAREIIAYDYHGDSWDLLTQSVILEKQPFQDELYIVFLHAIRTLTEIAFDFMLGSPHQCTFLLAQNKTKFHGFEIKSPWRKTTRRITVNEHVPESVGIALAMEIMHGLAHSKDLSSFGCTDIFDNEND